MGVRELDGRMYLPYYDARGRTVWYRSRRLDDPTGGSTQSKWLNPRGEHVRLYNVSDTQREEVWVCEGETDTMTMLSLILSKGLSWGAVGVPGASAFRSHWRWLLADTLVRIAYDGDEAGKREAMRLSRALRGVARDVAVVFPPDGEDLNSLWQKGRLEELVR